MEVPNMNDGHEIGTRCGIDELANLNYCFYEILRMCICELFILRSIGKKTRRRY
jgi:hypothetical protein